MNPLSLLAVAGQGTQLLLALALLAGGTAHALRSRNLLVIALVSGVAALCSDSLLSAFFPLARGNVQGTGWRFLGCALLFAAIPALLQAMRRAQPPLALVYEGFALHLAGMGALLLTLPGYLDRPLPGSMLTVGAAVLLAVLVGLFAMGHRQGRWRFLRAAMVYAAMGLWRLEWLVFQGPVSLLVAGLVTGAAAVLCWRTYGVPIRDQSMRRVTSMNNASAANSRQDPSNSA